MSLTFPQLDLMVADTHIQSTLERYPVIQDTIQMWASLHPTFWDCPLTDIFDSVRPWFSVFTPQALEALCRECGTTVEHCGVLLDGAFLLDSWMTPSLTAMSVAVREQLFLRLSQYYQRHLPDYNRFRYYHLNRFTSVH